MGSLADGIDRLHPLLLLDLGIGRFETRPRQFINARRQFTEIWLHGDIPGLLGASLGKLNDGVNDRLNLLMAEINGAEHDLLRQLLGFRFDHQYAGGRASNHQIEATVLQRIRARIKHVLAIDIANPGTADRAEEGYAGNC